MQTIRLVRLTRLALLIVLAAAASPAQDFIFSHQIIGRIKLTQLSGTGASVNDVITWNGSRAIWSPPTGGTAATQYQLNGTNVGSPRGTLDFLSGTGLNWTVIDTGAKVTTQPAIDTAVVLTRATNQAGTSTYCRSTTGNDTYVCSLTPALTAYTRGGCVVLDADTANTGAASVNIDALGARAILNRAGSALADGDITADRPITICYDGTNFIVQGDGGGGGSYSAGTGLTLSGSVFSVNTGTIAAIDDYQDGRFDSAVCTGTNAYTCNPAQAFTGALVTGSPFRAQFTNASTGAVTLNVSALGAKKAFKIDRTTQLDSGDLAANSWHSFVYDTDADSGAGGWIQQSGASGGGGGGCTLSGHLLNCGGSNYLPSHQMAPNATAFADSGYTATGVTTAMIDSTILRVTGTVSANNIGHYMKAVGSNTKLDVLCTLVSLQTVDTSNLSYCGIGLRRSTGGPNVVVIGWGGTAQNSGYPFGQGVKWLSRDTDGTGSLISDPGVYYMLPRCGTPILRADWSSGTSLAISVSCDGRYFESVASPLLADVIGGAPTEAGVAITGAYANPTGLVYHFWLRP